MLKQYNMAKIYSGKRYDRYLLPVVSNALKCNFEYLRSKWKYGHSKQSVV